MKFVTDRNDQQATAITIGVSIVVLFIFWIVCIIWCDKLEEHQPTAYPENGQVVISQIIYRKHDDNDVKNDLYTEPIIEQNQELPKPIEDVKEILPPVDHSTLVTETPKEFNVPPQETKSKKEPPKIDKPKVKDLQKQEKAPKPKKIEQSQEAKKPEPKVKEQLVKETTSVTTTNTTTTTPTNTEITSSNVTEVESIESNKTKMDISYTKILNRVKNLVVYPARARRIGVIGDVKLAVTLDRFGRIIRTSIRESSNSNILDEAAKKIGQQLIGFETEIIGKEYTLIIPISYKLK